MIVAIDGPAASGKGTIARRLAAHYQLPHLDTGLLYRATARVLIDEGTRLDDVGSAVAAARGLALTDFDEEKLRGREMGEAASVVGAMPDVRAALIDMQRRFAQHPNGAVLDGRDIGTVIVPEADAKLFVTADAAVRARRRFGEMQERDYPAELKEVEADIAARDERDRNRAQAPLRAADDAIVLDTSSLDRDDAIAEAIRLVERRITPRR